MAKIKVSIYLEPAQLRQIDLIAKMLHQKRALTLRDALNCYIGFFLKSKKRTENVVV